MKKLLKFIPALFIFFTINSFSQTIIDNICWIKTADNSLMPTETEDSLYFSNDGRLNSIFNQYNVTNYEKAFIYSKSPVLKKIVEIKCDSCDIDLLHNTLKDSFPNLFYEFERHYRPDSINTFAYTPSDQLWNAPGDPLWHLKKTECDKAWNITRGHWNNNISVFDLFIDARHPDIENKLILDHNPHNSSYTYSYQVFDGSTNISHGTAVSGMAAGETTQTGGTPNGKYASAGFETKMYFYNYKVPTPSNFKYASRQEILKWLQTASLKYNTNIITTSAYLECSNVWPPDTKDVIKEILDHGTTIIVPAGNGPTNRCHDPTTGNHIPYYPFHPSFDDRIIIVTSTDINDKHYSVAHASTHAHFPEVDISAPGFNVGGIKPSNPGDPLDDPYEPAITGTSYAAPLVASIASLLYDINPCLSPEDIDYIIKTSADPIVDASSYPGMVGAGRINAYRACTTAQTYGTKPPITSNTTWNSYNFVNGDLFVEAGATLTIVGTKVNFSKSGRIIVKPGGKLIIDNSILSNSCSRTNERWKGIRVWGDPTQRQNVYLQGTVEIKNNSIIENAEIGISTRDLTDISSKNGGMIFARQCTFKNNEKDVEILPYRNFQNTNPSNELRNRSFFFDCTFLGDDDDYPSLYPHMNLDRVNGIRILGCTFENDINLANKRVGIESTLASYEVNELCTGTTMRWPPLQSCAGKPTTFKRLSYGIRSYGLNNANQYTIFIKNSKFDSDNGAYLSDIDNVEVLSNDFIMIDPNALSPKTMYGLYLDWCDSYRIQENKFSSSQPTPSPSPSPPPITFSIGVGLVIHNLSGLPTEIYRNTFNNCYVGIEALGQNRNSTNSAGLELKCNKFNHNKEDFYVTQNLSFPSGFVGVRRNQGVILATTNPNANKALAGNIFTSNSSLLVSSYDNQGDYINYNHHSTANPRIVPVSGKYVNLNLNTHSPAFVYDEPNSCPIVLIPPPISVHTSSHSSSSSTLSSLQIQYNNLLDGGDPGLDDDVSGTTSQEIFDQYTELRNQDGFLSIDVLREVIENLEFSNVMVRNILVANSHGAKEPEIQDALDNRTPLLPSYMRYQINTSMQELSALEYLEGEISFYSTLIYTSIDNQLRIYRNDSVVLSDSIEAILLRAEGLEWKYKLLDYYKATGNTQFEANILLDIENNLPPNSMEADVHQEYVSYLDITNSINRDSIHNLDSAELVLLESFIGNNPLIMKEIVPALMLNNILPYQEPVYLPDGGGIENEENKPLFVEGKNTSLLAFPNPASTHITIAYKVNTVEENLSYILYNLEGRMIKSGILEYKQDEILLNVSKYSSGSYIIILKDGSRIINSQKITFNH